VLATHWQDMQQAGWTAVVDSALCATYKQLCANTNNFVQLNNFVQTANNCKLSASNFSNTSHHVSDVVCTSMTTNIYTAALCNHATHSGTCAVAHAERKVGTRTLPCVMSHMHLMHRLWWHHGPCQHVHTRTTAWPVADPQQPTQVRVAAPTSRGREIDPTAEHLSIRVSHGSNCS
jgi:hypothetical protein